MTDDYLINHTPTDLLHNKSPYKVLFKTAPDYEVLRVFRTLCYATIVLQPTNKFEVRAIK